MEGEEEQEEEKEEEEEEKEVPRWRSWKKMSDDKRDGQALITLMSWSPV